MTLPQRKKAPVQGTLDFGGHPSAMTAPERQDALTGPKSEEVLKVSKSRPRAAYHLDRDTPAHMMVRQNGDTQAVLPTPHALGVQFRPFEVGQPRSSDVHALMEHPQERNAFKHFTGQQVIPLHEPSPYAGPQELDEHGNLHERGPSVRHLYDRYGPDRSHAHKDWWDTHGTVKNVSTQAVLHTGQEAEYTGSHSYITGPLDPKTPAANILIHNGNPYVMDGHHRLAEHRGRGHDSFPANVVNLDQMRDSIAKEQGVSGREHVQIYPGHERDKQVEVSRWDRQQRMAMP